MKTETTKRERINHVNRVNIDLVNDLLIFKVKRNFDLQGTGLSCNLRPNKSKEACSTCSNCKKCMNAKNERNFIHQRMDAVSYKRRRRRKDNPRKTINPEWIDEKNEKKDIPFYEDEFELKEIEEMCEMIVPDDMELAQCLA